MAVLLPPWLLLPQDQTLHSPRAMYSPETGQELHLVEVSMGFMMHIPSMTSLEHPQHHNPVHLQCGCTSRECHLLALALGPYPSDENT